MRLTQCAQRPDRGDMVLVGPRHRRIEEERSGDAIAGAHHTRRCRPSRFRQRDAVRHHEHAVRGDPELLDHGAACELARRSHHDRLTRRSRHDSAEVPALQRREELRVGEVLQVVQGQQHWSSCPHRHRSAGMMDEVDVEAVESGVEPRRLGHDPRRPRAARYRSDLETMRVRERRVRTPEAAVHEQRDLDAGRRHLVDSFEESTDVLLGPTDLPRHEPKQVDPHPEHAHRDEAPTSSL